MFNPKEVANGFGNLLKSKLGLTNEEEEKLFNARLAVCKACPAGQGIRCQKCGCVITAKTKSIHSTCPDKLW